MSEEYVVGRVKLNSDLPFAINSSSKPPSSMLVALKRGAIRRLHGDENTTYVEAVADKMWTMLYTGVLELDGVDKDGEVTERFIPLTSAEWTSAFFKMLEHMDGKPTQVMRVSEPNGDGSEEGDSMQQWRRRSITIREETVNRYSNNADLYVPIDDDD